MSSKPNRSSQLLQQAVALQEQGLLDEAARTLRRAIALDPGAAPLHEARGDLLARAGRQDDALKSLNRAVALARGSGAALARRGALLVEMGRHQDALADFDRALELEPGLPAAISGRICAQARLVLPDGAPGLADDGGGADADSLLARGNALFAQGNLREAAIVLCNAIDLAPDRLDLHLRAGQACATGYMLATALEIFTRALKIDPDSREALWGRAVVYGEMARFEEALADLDRLHALDPARLPTLVQRDFYGLAIHDWSRPLTDPAVLRAGLERGENPPTPFITVALYDDPALHLAVASRSAAQMTATIAPRPAATEAPPAPRAPGRIRLGYFSADFRDHATLYLMAELLEQHDRERFEIIAFSFGRDDQGAWRARAKAAVDRFHDVQHQPDEVVVALAASCNLDIAVDLKGFTAESRTGLFAHRLAPVQINYLGYPGTIAAPFMDYLVADPVLIPAAEREYYTERVITLPGAYQPNCRIGQVAAPTMTRAEAGLPDDAFVYCSFNQAYKLQPALFARWMRILQAVDGAVLWLWTETEAAQRNLRQAATAAGVDPARLIFAPTVPFAAHLGRIGLADLFLDTFPYTAHTTASDALRAGLPLLTCAGRSFASRVAASLLTAAGLPELVTTDFDTYEAEAIALATDQPRHAALRERLHTRLPTSTLFDSTRYTRNFERALVAVHQRQVEGLLPEDVVVGEDG